MKCMVSIANKSCYRTMASDIKPHGRTKRLLLVNSIPPRQVCLHLLCDAEMPQHIQDHSSKVCQVALVIADGLMAAGLRVNRPLVRASALLHDITKPRSFSTGENHAQTGGEYLAAMGYGDVGEIVRQHVKLDHYFAAAEPDEAEVVNYADKRVLHDRVVLLDERMAYIGERYARTDRHRELFAELWQQTRVLEKRLFSYLSFRPEEMADQVRTSGSPPDETMVQKR